MLNLAIKATAIIVTTVATFIATTSTTACFLWELREPKMPESLIKRD